MRYADNRTQFQQAEKVILFGAGASKGSTKINAPPIGMGLFSELIKFDPNGWGTLAESLKNIFHDDFEKGMRELSLSENNMLPPLQKKMAAFFFQYTPDSQNLYKKFCERLKSKKVSVGLASLNYERFLEIALSESGLDLEVCLPHGSCNIFCDGASTNLLGAEIPGVGVTTTGLVYAINDETEYKYKLDHDSFPPVMSYFEPNKSVTSGVNFIDDQKKRWCHLCSSANEIYIIGVMPRSSDSHIWDPLKNTSAKIIYCGGVEGGVKYQAWSSIRNGSAGDMVLNGYFEEEFEKICNLIGI